MRLLLDTHVLLWLMEEDPRLRHSAQVPDCGCSEVYVSSASIWEIAIKWRLGKIEEDPQTVLDQLDAAGLRELQVTNRHAVATGRLPLLHNDPFDRLLVAQAIAEPMRLLTADASIACLFGIGYSRIKVCVIRRRRHEFFGPAAILGLCIGFLWGTGCSLAILYSIYLGGYRKAVEDSLRRQSRNAFARR